MYGGTDMRYKTELVEEITAENMNDKICSKIEEMEKDSYFLVTVSFLGAQKAVLVFKK